LHRFFATLRMTLWAKPCIILPAHVQTPDPGLVISIVKPVYHRGLPGGHNDEERGVVA
jgi:hypothetical protein